MSGCNVPKQLRFLKKSQYASREWLDDYTLGRLHKVIQHAKENVPLYTYLPEIDDIEEFPFLEKETIRDYPDLLISKEKLSNLHVKTTGGSTGIPLKVLKTQHARSWLLACMWRNYSWAGIKVADSRAHLWSTPVGKGKVAQIKAYIGDLINNRKRYSSFIYDKKQLEGYIRDITKHKPTFFYGYASALADLAQQVRDLGIKMPYAPKAIVSTADVLTPEKRELIESTFSAKVYNEYGCGELGPFVSECEHGNMHVSAENYFVEIIDKNGERCKPNEFGEIVVTELHNTAMPLIRYKTGDFGALRNEKCSCGRNLPLFIGPLGRDRDQFKKKDGSLIHGAYIARFLTEKMLKDSSFGISGYQFIQNSLETFTGKIVPTSSFNNDSKTFISKLFKDTFGQNVRIKFELVEQIERQKNGKLRLFIGMDK